MDEGSPNESRRERPMSRKGEMLLLMYKSKGGRETTNAGGYVDLGWPTEGVLWKKEARPFTS